jgi:hypothetical protein
MARSTAQNGSIITEGLVIHLDAAAPTSYTTGSTWYDLSRSGSNATIIGATTYLTANKGGIDFSGSSTSPRFSIPYTHPTFEPFAVDLWFTQQVQNSLYIRGMISCGELFGNFASGTLANAGWGISYYHLSPWNTTLGVRPLNYPASGVGQYIGFAGPNLVTGSTYNFFFYRNTNTQTIGLYVNGVFFNSASLSNTYTLSGSTNIGSLVWSGNNYSAPLSTFHNIKVYHGKNFTPAEIQQNYNALKGRLNP